MEAWKKNDIETVWDMMSPLVRHGNDDSFESFKDLAVKQGVRPSGYKIRKITVSDEIAAVETEIEVSDYYGRNLGSDWHECKLINVDGVWHIDDCKLIAP